MTPADLGAKLGTCFVVEPSTIEPPDRWSRQWPLHRMMVLFVVHRVRRPLRYKDLAEATGLTHDRLSRLVPAMLEAGDLVESQRRHAKAYARPDDRNERGWLRALVRPEEEHHPHYWLDCDSRGDAIVEPVKCEWCGLMLPWSDVVAEFPPLSVRRCSKAPDLRDEP